MPAAADVEAAFPGHRQHIFVWRQFGLGAPPISWVRLWLQTLFPPLRAADGQTSNEKTHLSRTVKKKAVLHLLLHYKPAMF